MAFALPRTLTLPSGVRVTLRRSARAPSTAAHGTREPRSDDAESLFAGVLALFEHDVELVSAGKTVDVHDLPLADFHVVRAFLTKAGFVPEEEVELECHNCGELLVARPCEGLETGPWEDGEANDPELDRTAAFDVPLAVTPIRLGRVRRVSTVTLAPRTVREAMPLFTALAEDPFRIDEGVVRAMGIKALGAITDPARIARSLIDLDEDAFGSVTDVFLEAHYPLRLACDVFCPKCRARNQVDAPTEREFDLTPDVGTGGDGTSEHAKLPSLDDFVELAHEIADPLIAAIPGEKAELFVESGTPDVDDGGDPLLGSYVPPPPKDAFVPTHGPKVTVYYRTFEKIEQEEGPFDWEAELRETIEHELEHHVFWLRGEDPMDEEEHAEIDREVVRVVGRGEATRRTLAVFGLSFPEFVRRAWLFIVLCALAFVIWYAEGRCGAPSID